MRIRLVKWLCIAVLFVSIVLWYWIGGYELPFRLVICSGAVVVAVQALHSARHRWTTCFVAIAVLFNPAIPVFPLATMLGLVTILLAGAAFSVSLSSLQSVRLLSMPSITDRCPGSESL
jgi:hypothetical protein